MKYSEILSLIHRTHDLVEPLTCEEAARRIAEATGGKHD